MTTLNSCSGPGRRRCSRRPRGSLAATPAPRAPASPAASSKSWPGVRIVTHTRSRRRARPGEPDLQRLLGDQPVLVGALAAGRELVHPRPDRRSGAARAVEAHDVRVGRPRWRSGARGSSAMSTSRRRTDRSSVASAASSAAARSSVVLVSDGHREERLGGVGQHPAAAHLDGGGQLGEVAVDVRRGEVLLAAAPHAEAGGLELVVGYVDGAGEDAPTRAPWPRPSAARPPRGCARPARPAVGSSSRAASSSSRSVAPRRGQPDQDPPAQVEVEVEPSGRCAVEPAAQHRPASVAVEIAIRNADSCELRARPSACDRAGERGVVQPLQRRRSAPAAAPATAATASCAGAACRRCPPPAGWRRRGRPRRRGRAARCGSRCARCSRPPARSAASVDAGQQLVQRRASWSRPARTTAQVSSYGSSTTGAPSERRTASRGR